MDALRYLNLTEFTYWPITKQTSWWFCFYANWTQIQQWILYNTFLPFFPGCEFGDKCFSKQRLRVVGQEYCSGADWRGERRRAGWACLSEHQGLPLAETPVLSYCVQKLLIVLYVRGSVVSASSEKAEGWPGSTHVRRHKPDLPSPPLRRKGCCCHNLAYVHFGHM